MKDMVSAWALEEIQDNPEDENKKTKGTEAGNTGSPSRIGNSCSLAGAGVKRVWDPTGWAVMSG